MNITSSRSVQAATLYYCKLHSICLSLLVVPSHLHNGLLKQPSLDVQRPADLGCTVQRQEAKGYQKITNGCRLIFCQVCDQFTCLLLLSSFSFMTGVSSISKIAKTVPLTRESQVMGPKDIVEAMSHTSFIVLQSHLSLLGASACNLSDAKPWLQRWLGQTLRLLWRQCDVLIYSQETWDFCWLLLLNWESPAQP